jgi:sulfur carrier protein
MTVTLNGEPHDVPPGTTVEQLITGLTTQRTGIAAAVNGEVVPRRAWPATPLADRDQVEVVTAVQGG